MEWLIAGLGNPGAQYTHTRHNVGFQVVDILSERWGIAVKRLKYQSLCGDGNGRLLLKPQTFMNLSGRAIRDAAAFYKLPPERVLVVYDDVSLPPGKLRIRANGSDGGHNGVKDILYHLQSDRFPRVKVGVGAKPHAEMDLADWVLSSFAAEERPLMEDAFKRAADAVEAIITGGVEGAMGRFNGNGSGV